MSGRGQDRATRGFEQSLLCFESVVAFLEGEEAATLAHSELEDHLEAKGRELLRRLLQDHLDLRAHDEERIEGVTDVEGLGRGAIEAGHERTLATVFGEVVVSRLAYRRRGQPNLHPADAVLNLPVERHSHGLGRLAAVEATRGSYDTTVEAIDRNTGQRLGKRQVEALAERAAADFEGFYTARAHVEGDPDDVLVISADGKGIVMRPEALRAATAKAAEAGSNKLATRLSKGEKRNRKRMAEVGAVYDLSPVPRTASDILARGGEADEATPAPRATGRWLLASVAEDAAAVVGKLFDEAERRDPTHRRAWVALVDGNNHQIERINAEAQARGVVVPILVDFIHVLEYLWKAVWSFYEEGDADAEAWVHDKAMDVLAGKATTVAAAIRRKATYHGLAPPKRAGADTCATYLRNKAPYLDYPTALEQGWPIATGVIEGAVRHLVKDRMDITGARWGLRGAEAVLKLRAVHSNGDFADYWHYHLSQERRRNHEERYADSTIPTAA